MKTIASFTVNHDTLLPGLYVSRVDGDIVTYDVRMKVPNSGDYLPTPAAHTIEHLFATYARNSGYANQVVYVGPMGCRTGFYLLLRDSVSRAEAIRLVQDSFAFIAAYEGEIPGATRTQCGNTGSMICPAPKPPRRHFASRCATGHPRKLSTKAATFKRTPTGARMAHSRATAGSSSSGTAYSSISHAGTPSMRRRYRLAPGYSDRTRSGSSQRSALRW